MKGKCWNCQKMNTIQQDGYCWCNCKNVKGGNGGLWYIPIEKVEDQDAASQSGKLFLDDEESRE